MISSLVGHWRRSGVGFCWGRRGGTAAGGNTWNIFSLVGHWRMLVFVRGGSYFGEEVIMSHKMALYHKDLTCWPLTNAGGWVLLGEEGRDILWFRYPLSLKIVRYLKDLLTCWPLTKVGSWVLLREEGKLYTMAFSTLVENAMLYTYKIFSLVGHWRKSGVCVLLGEEGSHYVS